MKAYNGLWDLQFMKPHCACPRWRQSSMQAIK